MCLAAVSLASQHVLYTCVERVGSGPLTVSSFLLVWEQKTKCSQTSDQKQTRKTCGEEGQPAREKFVEWPQLS